MTKAAVSSGVLCLVKSLDWHDGRLAQVDIEVSSDEKPQPRWKNSAFAYSSRGPCLASWVWVATGLIAGNVALQNGRDQEEVAS